MRMFKRLDAPVALPKLYVVTINQPLSVFFRDIIIGAHKLDCPEKAAVYPNNICPISRHLFPRVPRNLSIIKIKECLFGRRL
jgi:hypothetical protein